jgi:Uri superfamily endonuclease
MCSWRFAFLENDFEILVIFQCDLQRTESEHTVVVHENNIVKMGVSDETAETHAHFRLPNSAATTDRHSMIGLSDRLQLANNFSVSYTACVNSLFF